jgi:3-oxocholest-4-en-26-oate---CoA ligase
VGHRIWIGGRLSTWDFATLWESVAEVRGSATAVQQGERTVTWSEFDDRANALATWLVENVGGPQAKVAQHLYNCPEYLESVFASFKARLVPVNTNYRYLDDELINLWDNADVEVVVFHDSFTERVASIRSRLPGVRAWLYVGDPSGCPEWALAYDDVVERYAKTPAPPSSRTPDDLMLLYTGGTTGYPKGVMWRQGDLFDLLNRPGAYHLPSTGDRRDVERVLSAPTKHGHGLLVPCAPLMHANSLFSSMSTLTAGGTVILLQSRGFDATELLDAVTANSVTELSFVGDVMGKPIVDALEAHPGRWDFSSVWLVLSGGVMWSAETKQRLLAVNPKLVLIDTLGSSETVSVASSKSTSGSVAATGQFKLDDRTRVIDDDGQPIAAGSGDVGLLAIRGVGPVGYYKDEAKTAATFRVIDGVRWSITGDLATVEADGAVKLLGRGSGCINTGGEKVFPEEVEEVLKRHPDVADAVVVGVPDERFGETVTAVVERAGSVVPDPAALIAHVKQSLAGYKAPRHVLVVDTIGRGPNGKADLSRLREKAASSVKSGAA